MAEHKTNFAVLCEILDAVPQKIADAVGTDPTLVSRWRTGNRKLMPGRHWASKVSEYFWQLDAQRDEPVLQRMLNAYYPGQPLLTTHERVTTLSHWLTNPGQQQLDYQQRRYALLSPLTPGKLRAPAMALQRQSDPNKAMYGLVGLHGSIMEFLGLIARMNAPKQILFACPFGIEMLVMDEAFGLKFMAQLKELFEKGHRLSVVLKTGYRYSDVAQFSGRWLAMHLKGYIQSCYCDELEAQPGERMLGCVPGQVAFRVADVTTSPQVTYTTMITEPTGVDGVHERIKLMMRGAEQRFIYNFFRRSEGFLRDVEIRPQDGMFLYSALPHMGVAPAGEVEQMFLLTRENMQLLRGEYSPLLMDATQFTGPVRHVFCQDEIDEMLLKARHGCQPLSDILGRQVYMNTRSLARQIYTIKQLLANCKNYEVAFLPRHVMEMMPLEIGVWGSACAIGVSPEGSESTACRDQSVVMPLRGYCSMIWERIPQGMKSRTAVNRHLDMWLEKARRYGVWNNGVM